MGGERAPGIASRLARALLKLPIHGYRWSLKPLIGHECRYLPTCSEYALDAIDRNGAWRGLWLLTARLARCHPWGGSGFDPAPRLARGAVPWWAPWRHGQRRAARSSCAHAPAHEERHGAALPLPPHDGCEIHQRLPKGGSRG